MSYSGCSSADYTYFCCGLLPRLLAQIAIIFFANCNWFMQIMCWLLLGYTASFKMFHILCGCSFQFYLIINLAVGGTNGFFPDGVHNGGYSKPWRNSDSNGPEKFWKAKDLWYPTWKGDDASFQIDSVRMWQLA